MNANRLISLAMGTVVVILISLVNSPSWADGPTCGELFRIQKRGPLDELVDMEAALTRFQRILTEGPRGHEVEYQVAVDMTGKLAQLQTMFDAVADEVGVVSAAELDSDLIQLKNAVAKINEQFDTLVLRETNRDYALLIERPELVRAETFYDVHGLDPYVERVYFSKAVTEQVFWSEEQIVRQPAISSLRAITYGRTSSDGIGISRFVKDSSVYRIHFRGYGAELRLAGFFVGRDFYVTSWNREHKHGTNPMGRLIDDVNRARAALGF